MSDINAMTREDFEALPSRKWDEDIGPFDSLVIIPARVYLWDYFLYRVKKLLKMKPEIYEMRGIHDSSFRCMDFVAVKDDVPLCLLSGCSDVIHIDGIGGYGQWRAGTGIPYKISPKDWSIDCLRTSGLLRLFMHGMLTAGPSLSSLEIWGHRESPVLDGMEPAPISTEIRC